MPHPRFDAVLCDVDGVVRQWDGNLERVDTSFGLAPGTLAAVAFRSDLLTPAITGAITDEQWRASVAAELARQTGSAEQAQAVVSAWSRAQGRVDRAVLRSLQAARVHAYVVLVSNATTRLHTDLSDLGIMTAVDAAVSTADLGFVKPDPRVYTTVADEFRVAHGRCLFVDDTPEHVESARRLGMTGVEYRDSRQLQQVLQESGLI